MSVKNDWKITYERDPLPFANEPMLSLGKTLNEMSLSL